MIHNTLTAFCGQLLNKNLLGPDQFEKIPLHHTCKKMHFVVCNILRIRIVFRHDFYCKEHIDFSNQPFQAIPDILIKLLVHLGF